MVSVMRASSRVRRGAGSARYESCDTAHNLLILLALRRGARIFRQTQANSVLLPASLKLIIWRKSWPT